MSLCDDCTGICCQGWIEVYSSDEIYYDENLVDIDPDDQYDRRMKLNGTFCIALRYGKCGIYEKRPRVCRQFQPGCSRCINYRNGHLNGHKEFSIGDITEIS